MSAGKVLVLGDDTRSFLAIVRSLGRHGVEVHVAPARFTSPALRSRYIARAHEIPPWMGDGSAWRTAMETLLRQERFDLVIPCDETNLLPLARHREAFGALARLAIPDDASIAALFDKHATRELAREVGVPVAPGRLPRRGETASAVVAELGLPLMIKPRRSFALEGLDRRQLVARVSSQRDLATVLAEIDPESELLEGFVPGRGLGVSVLAHEGRVLQAFQHHRVREDASGSYYRVSADFAPAYLGAVEAMLAPLRYTGVAMFEFRTDPVTGNWVLLEVNARPWGSMPLAVHAGVDFPWAWYRLLVAGEALPRMEYRARLFGRNLVPDLRAILRELRREPWRMAGRILEFLRALPGWERYDVLVADDPAPGLRELANLAAAPWRRLASVLPGAGMRRRARAVKAIAAARWAAAGRALRVVVVCQGNICRSPFAEAMLRRAAEGVAVEVSSAGLMARPGRASPALAVTAAASFGHDMAAHRSAFLTRAAAEAADLIVVFDEINLRWLEDRYPGLATPALMLGDVAGEGELPDPVDGDAAVFHAAYGRIVGWTTTLAGLLRA